MECKKAQPKEVMLPANLAKTRAAGRTAYGELVVLSGGAGPSALSTVGGAPSANSVRYTPYPLPATVTSQQQHHQQHQTAHIIPIASPSQSILQYTTSPQHALYDAAAAVSYKRLLAATAAAATLRSHHHAASLHAHHQPAASHSTSLAAAAAAAGAHPRATATLTYPLSELLGLQGLDVSALYGLPAATLGL